MSEQRPGGRGTPNGGEGSWRARGRGRGRGRGATSASSRGHGPAPNPPADSRQRDSRIDAKPMTPGSTIARRGMNLVASVSRSSGLEKDGDEYDHSDIRYWLAHDRTSVL
ncbi:hypothetical protein CVT25_004198 [Psilocybe cyanescens]|uniref:Uncharacterized protein n=1 Tax=Psilocybe cyanescens TaxID=93625 RepID=A0A409X367_PSICY|nr:hypothetical protein CVT25_004198 [Psilocybe cyanescens]